MACLNRDIVEELVRRYADKSIDRAKTLGSIVPPVSYRSPHVDLFADYIDYIKGIEVGNDDLPPGIGVRFGFDKHVCAPMCGESSEKRKEKTMKIDISNAMVLDNRGVYLGDVDCVIEPSGAAPHHLCRSRIELDRAVPKVGTVPRIPVARKVIFNDPATIVMWSDGTKTVVKKSKDDIFDKDKGLAMCFLKKMIGDDYYKTIRKLLKEADDFTEQADTDGDSVDLDVVRDAVANVIKDSVKTFTELCHEVADK